MFQYFYTITAICIFSAIQSSSADTVFGSDDVADLRLVGGNRCGGRLEIRPATSTLYGQACNSRAGNTEASVICRQLGCVGANGTGQKVDPTRFGFSSAVDVYRGFGYSCIGNEGSLAACRRTGSVCTADSADHAIAIQCNGGTKTVPSTYVLIIGVLTLVIKWIY